MDEESFELKEEGFEEIPAKKSTNRPDFRVVQPLTDVNGKTIYKSVGAMWKSTSKNGNEFYVLKIGELKLLVFENTNK